MRSGNSPTLCCDRMMTHTDGPRDALVLLRHDQLYPLILRSLRQQASRRKRPGTGAGPHGSPGDAKHRPETALTRPLTTRITDLEPRSDSIGTEKAPAAGMPG